MLKVGDKVLILNWRCTNQAGGSNTNMKLDVGKTGKILTIVPYDGTKFGYRISGSEWIWDDRLLELVEEVATKTKPTKAENKPKVKPPQEPCF